MCQNLSLSSFVLKINPTSFVKVIIYQNSFFVVFYTKNVFKMVFTNILVLKIGVIILLGTFVLKRYFYEKKCVVKPTLEDVCSKNATV